VHAADGTLHAYSTADGTERWAAPIDYIPDTPPALLPDGTLVTGGRTTTVWRGTDDDHDDDAGPSPVVAVHAPDGDPVERWRSEDLHQLTNQAANKADDVHVDDRLSGSYNSPRVADT